jgi:hypothetical protein
LFSLLKIQLLIFFKFNLSYMSLFSIMKKALLIAIALFSFTYINAQTVTITAADMPEPGDTLRSSAVMPEPGLIDLSLTGTGINWDFSDLEWASQAVDTYRTATAINILYTLSFGQAYGTAVNASALTGGMPVPIPMSNVHNFYQKRSNPARFVMRGYGAEMSSVPTPVVYKDEDELYFFPLQFGSTDTSTFAATVSLPTLGGMKIKGKRRTEVDGEGTIVTPYFTTPAPCIRVKTVADEIDSIDIGFGVPIGIPRKTIEYKWLTPGEHYPALWVTATEVMGTENITSIRFRDQYRSTLQVRSPRSFSVLKAYPTPATGSEVIIEVPASWNNYSIQVSDLNGKLIHSACNTTTLDVSAWSCGTYIARIIAGEQTGFVRIVK